MAAIDEHILRTAKEIVVKFIETGRISPTGFHETFLEIYNTVEKAVKKNHTVSDQGEDVDHDGT